MNSPIEKNQINYIEIERLKYTLNNLIGDRQNDVQLDFDHDGYYYKHCRSIFKTIIKSQEQVDILKLELPLIEASVNVNKNLREYYLEKNNDNLLKLYNAQQILKLKIEETIKDNLNDIDKGRICLRMRDIICLIGLALSIIIFTAIVATTGTNKYLFSISIGSAVPMLFALIASNEFEDKNAKEIQIYLGLKTNQNAFKERNERFATFFKAAEEANEKKCNNDQGRKINDNTIPFGYFT